MPGKLHAEGLLMVPLELQPCVAEMPSLQKLLPEEQHCIAFSHAIVLAVEGKSIRNSMQQHHHCRRLMS